MTHDQLEGASRSIRDVLWYNEGGGALHLILCDNNTEDGHIELCEAFVAADGYDGDGLDKRVAAEIHCLGVLKDLTESERDEVIEKVWVDFNS